MTFAEPDRPEDRTLVERYLDSGDEAAFRELYRRHTPVIYRFALARVEDASEAEAVVQETWLRASRALGSFGWRATLRSWLVGIALNCCRERWRDRRRVAGGGAADDIADGSIAPRPGARLDLERCVASLPPRARDVLLLHDVEGFTHAEVGEILGIEAGTSKSQLSRARASLRRALSQDVVGGGSDSAEGRSGPEEATVEDER